MANERILISVEVPESALKVVDAGCARSDPGALYLHSKNILFVETIVKAAGFLKSGEKYRVTFIGSEEISPEDNKRFVTVVRPVYDTRGRQVSAKTYFVDSIASFNNNN